jgi:hypothetical protein
VRGRTSAWAVGVLICLVRLAGGWLVLVKLKRGDVDLGGNSNTLLSEFRDALGLTRDVKLGLHPAIASPVAIGFLTPSVLVPPDWENWPPAGDRWPERRAAPELGGGHPAIPRTPRTLNTVSM